MRLFFCGIFLFAVGCARLPLPLAKNVAPLAKNAVPPPPPIASPSIADTDDEDNDGGEIADAKDATEFFLKRRVPPGQDKLPIDRYLTARDHIRNMPAYSISAVSPKLEHPNAAGGWTSLGPGNVGGRTRSLVIDPNNPNTIYAGAVTGGVWKTVDGGKSWSPLTDLLPVLNVGSLVMDPFDSNTLYAGTGEFRGGFPGQGIFKTSDCGNTWTLLPATSSQVTFNFEYVQRLVMSPTNRNRIYAATWTGIFSSADGGATWTNKGLGQTQLYEGCEDLVIRTDQPTDYLFASCTGKTSTADYTIWRNTDAAGTGVWAQVFTAVHMTRTSLAIAPSQQSTIYAMAASQGGDPAYNQGLLAVYRSTSNGDSGSWLTRVTNSDPIITNTLLLTDSRSVTGSFCNGGSLSTSSGQGGWDNSLAVDPVDPNRVWAGGVDVFRSDDGGANWGVASIWQLPYNSPQFAHADRHLFVFHPAYDGLGNQTMYLATDGGVFRTDNARAALSTGFNATCQGTFTANSAIQWSNLNSGYAATQYYHGFAYPGGLSYMGGAQDNSVSRGTDAAGPNAFQIFSTGDGAAVGIDPADANLIFKSTQRLSFDRAVDGGSFVSATAGITESSANFPFIAFFAIDPNEGRRLYLGGTKNLWRSLDGGVTWNAAAPVDNGSSVGAVAVSPFDSNTVIFGSGGGFIYRNSDALNATGNTTWASAQPRFGFVSSIAFDPTNPSIVYAVYSSIKFLSTDAHVYRSIDGGATWTPSDGAGASSLPDIPMFRLIVNPLNPLQLFVGSDLGIFVSLDGGTTWNRDPSLENVVIEELALDAGNNSNWLFAFTYGRGAYRTPLPGASQSNCSYTVSPTSVNADAFGGVYPVTISAPPGCAWMALPGATPQFFGIQSPANGSGNSSAYIVTETSLTAARSDRLTIANAFVTVNQPTATVNFAPADSSAAPTNLNVPGLANIDSRPLTSSSTDPVHSCTSSADFKTAWWRVTPSITGFLNVRASARRYDIFGNSGIVVTAYPQGALNNELTCAVQPRDTQSQVDLVTQFAVTAGMPYLIEISATGPTSLDGGFTVLAVTVSTGLVSLSVTPPTLTLTAGSGNTQQFSANVANGPNLAVRWSLLPAIGVISSSGLYTPPPSIAAAATVTVTATSFADASKSASAAISIVPVASGLPVIFVVANATGEAPEVSPNTWIEIKGTHLGPRTRTWQGSDFVNNQLPTQLDGVSVMVNGKPAFVYFISDAQVNVLSPLDSAQGSITVQVTNSVGTSGPVTVQLRPLAPGFFQFPGGYAAATHANGTLLGPTTLFPGSTTPAKPGETIVLYGNGFGATSNPVVNGALTQSGTLSPLPVVTIGGVNAIVTFAGLVSVGEFQINVVVPPNLPNADALVVATYNGASTQANVLVSVHR